MAFLRRLLSGARSNSQNGDGRPAGAAQSSVDVRDVLREVVVLSEARRHADIFALISRALATAPDHPELLFAKAGALLDTGRCAEARALYERLDQEGCAATSLAVQLAEACERLGDSEAAEAALRKAIATDPQGHRHRFMLGAYLHVWKRHEEAVAELERAVLSDPLHADTRIMLGNALTARKDPRAAEAQYRKAAELAPTLASAWTNIGFALVQQDRDAESIEFFRRAYDLERTHGGDADAFNNYAIALADNGRFDEALRIFEENLPQRPLLRAHWNYALTLLRTKRFAEGWRQHEVRWMLEPLLSMRPGYGFPQWTGQSLARKTLVIRAEQGLGDTIQMLRYVPALAARGARVLLRSPPGFEVLGRNVEGLAHVLEQGTVNPPCDYYVPAMSLPDVFGTTLANMPADVPYIGVDPARRERWRVRLGSSSKRSIGLVWAGSPVHMKDRHRSIAVAALQSVLATDGVRFVALQKGPAAREITNVPQGIEILDLGAELEDLADTAAVIEALDLVIGVDTAVVHLAGALAKPVWTLIADPCDWRWMEDRDDSPWYPTMRLYRQRPRHDWRSAIEKLTKDLREWVSASLPSNSKIQLATERLGTLAPAEIGPADAVSSPGLCAVAEARWGIMQYNRTRQDIGDSVYWYGEWLEWQIRLLLRMLPPGAVALESGSGIGIHALALAHGVGSGGRVYACDSDPMHRRILRNNVEANGQRHVVVTPYDPGRPGAPASESLDAMQLEGLALLKCLHPAQAPSLIAGATQTLWRARPTIFLAASDGAELATTAGHVKEFGYRCWQMVTPLFDPDNFNRRSDDIFSNRVAIALLAMPEEVEVAMALPGCTELH
jgi:tetratricopeptide (TPR) repeat protein